MNNKMSAELAAETGTVVGEPYTPPGRTAVFDVPSYDDIADLQQLFKRFANTAAAYSEAGGGPFVDKTASFTLTPADLSKTYLVNTQTVATITVPDPSGLNEGDRFNVIQGGPAKATVSGTNVVGLSSTNAQFEGLSAVVHSGKWWCIPFGSSGGSGGGGPIPVFNTAADTILGEANSGGLVAADSTLKSLIITVPKDDGSIPIGSAIVVSNVGTASKNTVTLRGDTGVVIQDRANAVIARYGIVTLVKRLDNTWLLSAGSGGGQKDGPAAPELVSAVGVSDGVLLEWAPPIDDGGSPVIQYLVEKSTDLTTWDAVKFTGPEFYSTVIQPLTVGTSVSFRMKALNENGLSDASNVLSGTPTVGFNDASGGKVTEYEKDGRYFRAHLFTAGDTFVVTKASNAFAYAMVAGGGGGGQNGASSTNGSGGAGGFLQGVINLEAKSYPIVVGVGATRGNRGDNTSFNGMTCQGGGPGGGPNNEGGAGWSGGSGGSGGGGGGNNDYEGDGGPGTSGQGFSGGHGAYGAPGGGGGAGGPATNLGRGAGCDVKAGGPGITVNLLGTPVIFGAGGNAPTGGTYGGGGGGACGGYAVGGQNGAVVISYEIQEIKVFNNATGGDVTEFEREGKYLRRHTFDTTDKLVVVAAPNPFTVLAVGGGANGAAAAVANAGQGGGGGGGCLGYTPLDVGDHDVVVGGPAQSSSLGSIVGFGANGGVGGTGSGGKTYNGGNGGGGGSQDVPGNPGSGGAPGFTVLGTSFSGGGGGGGAYRPGGQDMAGGSPGVPNGGGGGAGTSASAVKGSDAVGFGGGGGGGGWRVSVDANSGGAGRGGVVVVEYEIAKPTKKAKK